MGGHRPHAPRAVGRQRLPPGTGRRRDSALRPYRRPGRCLRRITTKRVYKDAFQHDVARSIIVEESGTHFDPDVVEAFLATEQEFIAIREV